MKRLYSLIALAFFSLGAQAAPPPNASASATALSNAGNPIDELQMQIDQLFVMVTSLEERVTQTEQNIATLEATAASLQKQILSNDGDIASLQKELAKTNAMIYKLQQELLQVEKVLAQKQNILNGHCGTGEYLSHINPDGSIVCHADAGATGLVRTTVYRTAWLKECVPCIFNCSPFPEPPCPTEPAAEVVANCPSGFLPTSGGWSADPWVNIHNPGIRGNGYGVSADLWPIMIYAGGNLNVHANCLGLAN